MKTEHRRLVACHLHRFADGHPATADEGDELGLLKCMFKRPYPTDQGKPVGGIVCPMCRWEGDPRALRLRLAMLPDVRHLGGNARVHPLVRARHFAAEKEAWWVHVRAWLMPPYPRFERAAATVTLVFPQRRTRDLQDNFAVALKPLWDALVDHGVLTGDDSEHLEVGPLQQRVDRQAAPLTVLYLREIGECL